MIWGCDNIFSLHNELYLLHIDYTIDEKRVISFFLKKLWGGKGKMIKIKEHENLQKTGGYIIFKKQKNSKWIYIQFWGVYGTKEVKSLEDDEKEAGVLWWKN